MRRVLSGADQAPHHAFAANTAFTGRKSLALARLRSLLDRIFLTSPLLPPIPDEGACWTLWSSRPFSLLRDATASLSIRPAVSPLVVPSLPWERLGTLSPPTPAASQISQIPSFLHCLRAHPTHRPAPSTCLPDTEPGPDRFGTSLWAPAHAYEPTPIASAGRALTSRPSPFSSGSAAHLASSRRRTRRQHGRSRKCGGRRDGQAGPDGAARSSRVAAALPREAVGRVREPRARAPGVAGTRLALPTSARGGLGGHETRRRPPAPHPPRLKMGSLGRALRALGERAADALRGRTLAGVDANGLKYYTCGRRERCGGAPARPRADDSRDFGCPERQARDGWAAVPDRRLMASPPAGSRSRPPTSPASGRQTRSRSRSHPSLASSRRIRPRPRSPLPAPCSHAASLSATQRGCASKSGLSSSTSTRTTPSRSLPSGRNG